MKKFLCTIFAAVLGLVTLAGCGSSTDAPKYHSTKDGEWIEIQSITYHLNTSSTSLTSRYKWDTSEIEYIDEDEYQNAQKNQKVSLSGIIDIDRQDLLNNLSQHKGKERYYYDTEYSVPSSYYKATLLTCNLLYIKVRFLENEVIEVSYCEMNEERYYTTSTDYTTIRIKPLSYSITYFND